MEFSTREVAITFWLSIFLIWATFVARSAVLNLLRAICAPSILSALGLAISYIVLCLALLHSVGLWEFSNLKTALLWTFTVAFVGLFRANKIDEDPKFFVKTFRETFKIAVLIEFLIGNYTFNLWLELILVPAVTFLVLLQAVARTDEKNKPALTLLTWISVAVGLAYLTHALYEASLHLRDLETKDTVRELLIPIVLSLMFLPFLFFLNLFLVYSNIFLALRWAINDELLRRYAKRRAFCSFLTSIDFLKRWRQLMMIERPDDRLGVDRVFAEIRDVRRNERDRPTVNPDDGWSPYAAIKFLEGEGFVNEDYHRVYDSWLSTEYQKIGKTYSINRITYQVVGNTFAATELALELTIFDPKEEGVEGADSRFGSMAGKLLKVALGEEKGRRFCTRLDGAEVFDLCEGNYRIRLSRNDWQQGMRGYEREFVISLSIAPAILLPLELQAKNTQDAPDHCSDVKVEAERSN